MTKVMTLEEFAFGNKKKKKIEFIQYLTLHGVFDSATPAQAPDKWDNIILFDKDYAKGLDLMIAFDEGRGRVVFLGHWNDGVV